MRFVILFSMIIPISWRISLDFAKLVYKRQMTSDRHAPCHLLRATCYVLLATCYLLLATCCLLLATCCLLRDHLLQAAARAAGSLFDAA